MKAIVEMRKILLRIAKKDDEEEGFDVFLTGCSIASLAMNVFRYLFLEEKQLAIVPELVSFKCLIFIRLITILEEDMKKKTKPKIKP